MDSIPMNSNEVVRQLRQRMALRHEVVYDNAKHRVDKSLTIDFAIANQSTHIERKFKMMSAQEIYSTYRCARDEAGTLQAVELYRFVHYPVSVFAAFTDVSRLVEMLPQVMASEDTEKLMLIISKRLYKSIEKMCNKRDGLKLANKQTNQLMDPDEIRVAEKVSLFEHKFSIAVFTTHENQVLANVAMDALDANLPNLKKALKACLFGKGPAAAVHDPIDGTESHADNHQASANDEQHFVISVCPVDETKPKAKAGNKLLYLLGVRSTPESKRMSERMSITSEISEAPTEFTRHAITEQVVYEQSSGRPSNADSVESTESEPHSWTQERFSKKNCDKEACENTRCDSENEDNLGDEIDTTYDEEQDKGEEDCLDEDENSDEFEEQASDAEADVESDVDEQDAGIESDAEAESNAEQEIVESVIQKQGESEVCNVPPRRPSGCSAKTNSRSSSRRESVTSIKSKLAAILKNRSSTMPSVVPSVLPKLNSNPKANVDQIDYQLMDQLSEPEEQKKVSEIVKVYEQLSFAVAKRKRANDYQCAKTAINNLQCAGGSAGARATDSNVTTARWQSSVPAQVIINVEVTANPEKDDDQDQAYTVKNIVWKMNNERPRTLKEALRTLSPAQQRGQANRGKGAGNNKTVILEDVPRREGAYPVLTVPRCMPHLAAVRATAPVAIEKPTAAMVAAVEEQAPRKRDGCVVLTHPRFLSQKVAENQARPTACTPAPAEAPAAPQQVDEKVTAARAVYPTLTARRFISSCPSKPPAAPFQPVNKRNK